MILHDYKHPHHRVSEDVHPAPKPGILAKLTSTSSAIGHQPARTLKTPPHLITTTSVVTVISTPTIQNAGPIPPDLRTSRRLALRARPLTSRTALGSRSLHPPARHRPHLRWLRHSSGYNPNSSFSMGPRRLTNPAADPVQSIYLNALRDYKPKAESLADAEGQVKKWSPPATPSAPDSASAAELAAYESQVVEVEGQEASADGQVVESKVEDWFEEEATFGTEEPHGH